MYEDSFRILINETSSSTHNHDLPPMWSEFGWMQPSVYYDRQTLTNTDAKNLWALRSEAFRLSWRSFLGSIDAYIGDWLDNNIKTAIEFIETTSKINMPEVPTCFAFVGISIADHFNVLKRLCDQLEGNQAPINSRKTVILRSHDCPSVSQALCSIIDQLIMSTDFTKIEIKDLTGHKLLDPSPNYDSAISKLDEWFEMYEPFLDFNANATSFVIVFEDTEFFPPHIIDGIIRFCHCLRNEYKIADCLIMGISFSSHFVESICDPETFRKLLIKELDIFNSKIIGKKLSDMLMHNPTLLPFIIPKDCIERIEQFFTLYNFSISCMIKQVYYICFDFFSTSELSFINRPLDHLYEQLTHKKSSDLKYDVENFYRKLGLLIEYSRDGLSESNKAVTADIAAFILERKCAINLILKFDKCLCKFQNEVGEVPRERIITDMNERQMLDYKENSAVWLFRRAQTQPSIMLDFLRTILRSFEGISQNLTEIQENSLPKIISDLPTNYEKHHLYNTLKSELYSIMSSFDAKNCSTSQAQRVKTFFRNYLQTLLLPNTTTIVNKSFYIWDKSPAWLTSELNPNTAHESFHLLANLLPDKKSITADHINNPTYGTPSETISNNPTKHSPLLIDIALLYRIYENSGHISNLWDWFCSFCQAILKNNKLLSSIKTDGKSTKAENHLITLFHTRFCIGIGTLGQLIGILTVKSHKKKMNDIQITDDTNSVKPKKKETLVDNTKSVEKFILENKTWNLLKSEKDEFISLKKKMCTYRIKKLYFGKILEEENKSSTHEAIPIYRKRKKL